MNDTQRDVEHALFGTPNGFIDMFVGLVLMVLGPIRLAILLFKKRAR